MNILFEIPPKQKQGTWVGVDSEFFEMDKKFMHLPISGKFACLQIALPNEDVYVITDEKDIQPALNAIDNCMWVMMKAQFDISQLRRYADVPDRDLMWDIMYIEKILWGGYFDQYSSSLADMARRYLSIHVDKEVRDRFETATELDDELIKYAAEDALFNLKIAEKQRRALSKEQYEKVWQDIDLPATWALLASKPFRVDKDAWEQLAIENKKREQEIDATLPFNPRSYGVVKKELRKAGFHDLPSTGVNILEEYIAKFPDTEAAKLARTTLESRKYGKRANTYGLGFIENYLFQEGDYWVMKPDYFTIGAETGRISCSGLHQIPIRDTKDFRKCFLPRDGNMLVVGDYSSQEPRTAAYFSQDKEYIRVMNSGEDIYTEATFHIYADREDALAHRSENKSLILGTTYGLTKYGLSRRLGFTLEKSEEFINSFFSRFPKLHSYLLGLSQKTNYVETAVGRKIWLNIYSSQCANNAQNAPHQGTAADMIKKAIAVCYRDWKKEWGEWALVECVHDEIAFDVPKEIAQSVSDWVERKMVGVAEEMCPGVKFEVDVQTVENWSDAK